MRAIALMVVCVFAFCVSGCHQQTASEKLAADAKKAANQMNKDVNNLLK